MAFIGNQPTAVPLTSSQLVDGIITTGKIADGAVVNVDVNSTAAIAYSKLNLATSIVNGDIANATIALAKLSATGTPSASTFLRGDNSWASAGGTNTPNFKVRTSSAVTVGGGASTKVTWNIEDWDTDSAFASSTFTVPSGKAGKYVFFASNEIQGSISGRTSQLRFYLNGADQPHSTYNVTTWGTAAVTIIGSYTANLSVSDTVEIYIYSDNDAPKTTGTTNSTYWYGYRLVE
jgi:hypothetical protein